MNTQINDPTFITTLEGAGSCFKCRTVFPRLKDCAPTYFEKGYVQCGSCGENADLWHAAVDRATHLSVMSTWPLAFLGAANTSFVLSMETGKYYPIELTNYEVSANARILSRHYSSQGGEDGCVTAVEFHPNHPTNRITTTLLPLLAIPILEGPLPRTGPVGVNIVWVRSEDSLAWPYLVTALEAAAARDYAPCLVFAQSAVEISMMPLIEKRFRLHAPEKKVERFTNYYRALHVVLPYLCGEAKIAPMPGAVRDALDRLRLSRNHIIHKGVRTSDVKPEDAMEGLCAAAFGFEYMRYIEPLI